MSLPPIFRLLSTNSFPQILRRGPGVAGEREEGTVHDGPSTCGCMLRAPACAAPARRGVAVAAVHRKKTLPKSGGKPNS